MQVPHTRVPNQISVVSIFVTREKNLFAYTKPFYAQIPVLRNNNIKTDNSEDFQKVIIDHRSEVSHTTVRGLTKCGTMVNFEINKHSDFFHVLEKDEDNVEYNESLSAINMLVTVGIAFVIKTLKGQ